MRKYFYLLGFCLVSTCAFADWEFSVAGSANYQRNTERNSLGSNIVKEQAYIPGANLAATYRQANWCSKWSANWVSGKLNYDGQLQSGVTQNSQTKTGIQRLQWLLGYRVIADNEILVGIEKDHWNRDIKGVGDAAGLEENYKSQRLLLGINTPALVWSSHRFQAQLLWVRSEAETIDVNFGRQIFDPVTLKTHSSDGYRIELSYQHNALPDWRFILQLDSLNIPASASYPLYKNQQFAGSVMEPAHSRRQLGLNVEYQF